MNDRDSEDRRTDRPIPRTLAGWPEGSTYVPREPVFLRDILAAEREDLQYAKQHRGRPARAEKA